MRAATTRLRFRWPVLESTAELCILRNPDDARHYELVTKAISVASTTDMIADVRTRRDGPVPVVAPSDAITDLRAGTIELESYVAGHASLLATVQDRALLLVRDTLSPGWMVEVNGVAVKPYPAAGIYFAVPLGTGLQHVRMEYRTPGFRAGLVIFALWTAGVTLAATLARRRASS